MFGWFRNLAKRSSFDEDTRLVLDQPQVALEPEVPAVDTVTEDTVVENVTETATEPAESATPEQPSTRRGRHAAPAAAAESTPAAPSAVAAAPALAEAEPEVEAPTNELPEPTTLQQRGLVAAPSAQPAMPMSAHPNFAGLELARWNESGPQLLEPEAALTPEAQRELLKLFDDLFGPAGRYRLEWRTDRRPSDDAMFAEIMTADLVRRVQNTIADVAELERPEALPEITARREPRPQGTKKQLPKAS